MSEHEREVEEMQERSDRLGEQIGEAREDWEHKQRDPSVPGAVGEPASENELPPPEPDETD
jgi:hypothetical protein